MRLKPALLPCYNLKGMQLIKYHWKEIPLSLGVHFLFLFNLIEISDNNI